MNDQAQEWLSKAMASWEKAQQQTHRPEAMLAHAELAGRAVQIAKAVVELAPDGIEPERPAKVLDCHDRLWLRFPDGDYADQSSACGVWSYDLLSAHYGPLKEVAVG